MSETLKLFSGFVAKFFGQSASAAKGGENTEIGIGLKNNTSVPPSITLSANYNSPFGRNLP